MRNPFHYGGIVGADSFCNREKELTDLLRAMENGDNLFIYAERRIGKTSLIKRALGQLPKDLYIAAYIDLWSTDNEESFIAAYARSLTEAYSTVPQKMLEFAGQFFSRLVPSITLDDVGKPQVTFGMSRDVATKPNLEDVLKAPIRMKQTTKKNVVIVFDEFQQILEYESDLVERCLRSSMQMQEDVGYIFSGSRQHLIKKMVLDKSRPLYRAGGHYPLGAISSTYWISFVKSRFEASGRVISSDQVLKICQYTQGHPFYTQHLAHALWEITEESVTDELIIQAVDLVLEREDYAFSAIWDSLPLNQRRLLEGIAREPSDTQPYAAHFLDRYDLRTASTAQRAAKALLERDLIDRESGFFHITDRFFRLWIIRQHQ
ncbi:MAG: ATP-binding protein [Candidatus Obscuribacterales bacterium]|nr:ATP-binding protein [Candidatus Obscuribacterales bacterium]